MKNTEFEMFERFHQGIGLLLHDLVPFSASLNALLKKAMGFSRPSPFFFNKTVATVSKEEKEKTRNSLE